MGEGYDRCEGGGGVGESYTMGENEIENHSESVGEDESESVDEDESESW